MELQLRTEADVHQALARELGREPDEEVWAYLVRRRDVGNVLDPVDSVEEEFRQLVREYRELERLVGRGSKARRSGPVEREISPDERTKARMWIMALEAADLPEVRAFREKWLPDGLLADAEQAAAWVQAKLQEEPPTYYLELPLDTKPPAPSDPDFWPALRAAFEKACEDRIRPGLRVESLHVPTLGSVLVDKGALAELKAAAGSICSRHGWQESEAVLFVLTGIFPNPPKARATLTYRFSSSVVAPMPEIVVRAEARVPVREVAELYRKVRQEAFSGRDRPLSRKAAELAVFLYRTRELSWEERHKAWNQEHPEWQYPEGKMETWNFAKEAMTAFSRVTGSEWQKLEWKEL